MTKDFEKFLNQTPFRAVGYKLEVHHLEETWNAAKDKVLEILHKHSNLTERSTEYLCDYGFQKAIKQIEKL